jgi:hypothetical protein
MKGMNKIDRLTPDSCQTRTPSNLSIRSIIVSFPIRGSTVRTNFYLSAYRERHTCTVKRDNVVILQWIDILLLGICYISHSLEWKEGNA